MVGGSIPVFDEVIVCTELLNSIIHLDDTSGNLQLKLPQPESLVKVLISRQEEMTFPNFALYQTGLLQEE